MIDDRRKNRIGTFKKRVRALSDLKAINALITSGRKEINAQADEIKD